MDMNFLGKIILTTLPFFDLQENAEQYSPNGLKTKTGKGIQYGLRNLRNRSERLKVTGKIRAAKQRKVNREYVFKHII